MKSGMGVSRGGLGVMAPLDGLYRPPAHVLGPPDPETGAGGHSIVWPPTQTRLRSAHGIRIFAFVG